MLHVYQIGTIFLIITWTIISDAQDITSILAFESAYSLYIEEITTNSAFLDATKFAATDPAFLTVPNLVPATLVPESLTAPPVYLSQFPSSLQSFFCSVYSRETMLAEAFSVNIATTVSLPEINPSLTGHSSIVSSSIPVDTKFPTPMVSLSISIEGTDLSSNIVIATDPIQPVSTQIATVSVSMGPMISFPTSFFTRSSASAASNPIPAAPTFRAGASAGASARASASSNEDSQGSSSSSFSPSSFIGIGIGIGLAGVIILLLAFAIVRLARRTKRLRAQLEVEKGREPGLAVPESQLSMNETGVAVMSSGVR